MQTSGTAVVIIALIGIVMLVSYETREPAPRAVSVRSETFTVIESRIELAKYEVAQGETLTIELFGDVERLSMEGREIPFSEIAGKNIAVVGVDTRAPIGESVLTYTGPERTLSTTFRIAHKAYPVTKIVIPPSLARKGVTSERLAASIAKSDVATLSRILDTVTDRYYFTDTFVEPLERWTDVGGFGNIREDERGAIRHLGVDLEGNTGDPVYAANRGVVAYAGALPNYGSSVVIDHGLGIFSLYLHLFEIKTEKEAIVERGETIGLLGESGDYTLAPHLHFSVKVRDVSVNPRDFIDTLNATLNSR